MSKKINTFSIVGYDPKNQEWGIAVASKFLAVGAVVPYAKAGVGAVATQSWANLSYGPKALEYLEQGFSPKEIVNKLIEADEQKEYRQFGIVSANGESATYSGSKSYEWSGGMAGTNFAVQGNILSGENVVKVMADTFNSQEGSLAERLLLALKAGEDAGGDRRGKQSASLLIVKENGSYGGYNDQAINLRVDDHHSPVDELMRLYHLHVLYFKKTKEEDILILDETHINELSSLLNQLNFNVDKNLGSSHFYEQLQAFQLIENFDERYQEPGKIDMNVLEFMRKKVAEGDGVEKTT